MALLPSDKLYKATKNNGWQLTDTSGFKKTTSNYVRFTRKIVKKRQNFLTKLFNIKLSPEIFNLKLMVYYNTGTCRLIVNGKQHKDMTFRDLYFVQVRRLLKDPLEFLAAREQQN
jgi:hypothetical protein